MSEPEVTRDSPHRRATETGEGELSEPVTARIFRNGRNQAVRIPVEMSFDTDTVLLEKRGDTLIVRPRYEPGWQRFFADPSLVLPEDFEVGEDLPPQDRDFFE